MNLASLFKAIDPIAIENEIIGGLIVAAIFGIPAVVRALPKVRDLLAKTSDRRRLRRLASLKEGLEFCMFLANDIEYHTNFLIKQIGLLAVFGFQTIMLTIFMLPLCLIYMEFAHKLSPLTRHVTGLALILFIALTGFGMLKTFSVADAVLKLGYPAREAGHLEKRIFALRKK